MIEMQQKKTLKWKGNNMEEAHELTQRLETPRNKNWGKGDLRGKNWHEPSMGRGGGGEA